MATSQQIRNAQPKHKTRRAHPLESCTFVGGPFHERSLKVPKFQKSWEVGGEAYSQHLVRHPRRRSLLRRFFYHQSLTSQSPILLATIADWMIAADARRTKSGHPKARRMQHTRRSLASSPKGNHDGSQG